jgi:hypothetical protein
MISQCHTYSEGWRWSSEIRLLTMRPGLLIFIPSVSENKDRVITSFATLHQKLFDVKGIYPD